MKNTIIVAISGMDCASCTIVIDGTLEETIGIDASRTDYRKEQIAIVYDEKKISVQRILEIIDNQGYKASLIG